MARIHIDTIGCRLNQAESERIARAFRLEGHQLVDDPTEADLRVVNTCTVTQSAGRDSRRAARPTHATQRIVVTGCHSEMVPGEFADADLVVANSDKERLAAIATEQLGKDGLALGMDQRGAEKQLYPLALASTRAFVKIQDGCDLSCSFCLTTLARGPGRSRSAADILEEVRTLTEQGCREIVLTGVHAGSYGLDIDRDLAWLVEDLLEHTSVGRIRLSSLEPWNFQHHWMELWSRFPQRLCRHLHMSLQSGSDRLLPQMRRAYDTTFFRELLQVIREHQPDMAITTDIICGFPGETDADHQASLAFVEECAFAGAHVFTFSPRPGTEAALLPDAVDPEIRRLRAREVRAMVARSESTFRQRAVGTQQQVLWERDVRNGRRSGLTDHYIKVHGDATHHPANTMSPLCISEEMLTP